jgi:hypothetical protein
MTTQIIGFRSHIGCEYTLIISPRMMDIDACPQNLSIPSHRFTVLHSDSVTEPRAMVPGCPLHGLYPDLFPQVFKRTCVPHAVYFTQSMIHIPKEMRSKFIHRLLWLHRRIMSPSPRYSKSETDLTLLIGNTMAMFHSNTRPRLLHFPRTRPAVGPRGRGDAFVRVVGTEHGHLAA